MGWFDSFISGVVSTVKAVASVAVDVASTAVTVVKKTVAAAKELAGKALGFIAENGERLVEKVKETWKRVAPVIKSHVKPLLDKAEVWLNNTPGGIAIKSIPVIGQWIGPAVTLINRGLEALLDLENSPILKTTEKAIRWATDKAKKYKDVFLDKAEVKEVEKQKQALHEAASKLNNVQYKKSLALAEMIHDFVLVRSAIKRIFDENSVADLDHYLRLRATQKLLNEAQNKIDNANSIDDISSDDMFLLQVGANLISTRPTLTDQEANQLEAIVQKRFGKPLIVFVFEEMVMAWSSSLESMEKEWADQSKLLSKDRTLLRRLEQTLKLGGELDTEEKFHLEELRKSVPVAENNLTHTDDLILAKKKYIYASEGLLQVLENSDMEDYLVDGARKVGELVVNLSQTSKAWSDLTDEEQGLINDYANIFEEASKARAQQLVKVAV